METVKLTPQVLEWAAAQIGSTLYELAHGISKRAAERIVGGELTTPQVLKFAKIAGVPFGYLFLDTPPPARKLGVADFRTLPDAHPLGRDFFEVFDDIEYKQAWYREYLQSVGADPRAFVGKFKGKAPAARTVAADMREALGIAEDAAAPLNGADEHFTMLVSKCEEAGVLVFKNGVVGNNTRRQLSVQEFRGFALSDPLAPVVFVNGADAPAAWVFTLAHELAHIWLGQSGVSDAAPQASNPHERLCNEIAAEFLVPAEVLGKLWAGAEVQAAADRIELARRHFKVSSLVIARRALALGLISQRVYTAIYEGAKRSKKGTGESGGDFYRTLATRNSKKFSRRVASLAVSGNMTLREAGRLLNTNPNNVVKFHAKRNALPV